MNPIKKFEEEVQHNIAQLGADPNLPKDSLDWMLKVSAIGKYTYNFRWLGRPIIQYPQDIVAMQELIWEVRPDLVIETGIAHGGSLVLSASMLAILDVAEAVELGKVFDPAKSRRKVLGIDIDIREHNRVAIEAHPLVSWIHLIQGSSIAADVVRNVHEIAAGYQRVLVCLDSNHTHDHVLAELSAYAPLVSIGSYCVVFDTLIEQTPGDLSINRPWGPGDNPKTAVQEYLKTHSEFKIDKNIQNKLLITVSPDGYLKRIR